MFVCPQWTQTHAGNYVYKIAYHGGQNDCFANQIQIQM